MLRILGQISIWGTKASLERLASIASIPSAVTKQVGLKRRVPETDSWCYASPRYRFRFDTLDDEVRDFLLAHEQLGSALAIRDPEIRYALFTLCPVNQSHEETFACLLSHETLQALARMGVALELAPESVMPDAPYWLPTQTP